MEGVFFLAHKLDHTLVLPTEKQGGKRRGVDDGV